jgi:hypothetical protein
MGNSLVGDHLQGVRGEVALVHEHVVVGGAAGALDAGVAAQVEVVLEGVGDRVVHHRSCMLRKRFQIYSQAQATA